MNVTDTLREELRIAKTLFHACEDSHGFSQKYLAGRVAALRLALWLINNPGRPYPEKRSRYAREAARLAAAPEVLETIAGRRP